jgi:hypothetical protein
VLSAPSVPCCTPENVLEAQEAIVFQLLGIVAAIIGLILAFVSVQWAWLPPAIMVGFLYLLFFGLRSRRHGPVPELSWKANELLGKFGHFYAMPFAGSNASSAASITALAAGAIGVVSAIKGFWLGLGVGVALYVVAAPLARQFNPSSFLIDDAERAAHEEILQWFLADGTDASAE